MTAPVIDSPLDLIGDTPLVELRAVAADRDRGQMAALDTIEPAFAQCQRGSESA